MTAAQRALDAKIAEKIMGWTDVHFQPYTISGGEWHGHMPGQYAGNTYLVPHYHIDIAAAWQVWEKLAPEQNWSLEAIAPGLRIVVRYTLGQFLEYDRAEIARGESAPEAICRAALSIIGGIS